MRQIRIPQTKRIIKLIKSATPVIYTMIIIFSMVSIIFPVQAKTAEEIEKEIEEKQKELEALENALSEAESTVKYSEMKMGTTSSELEMVQAELEQIEAEREKNEAEFAKIEQELSLKDLELEREEMRLSEKLMTLYVFDRRGLIDVMLENGGVDGFWKDYKYRETLFDIDFGEVQELANEVASLKEERNNFELRLTVIQEENARLAEKKKELEDQITYLNSTIAYNTNLQSGIRAQMGTVIQQVEGLTAEQQAAIEQETIIIEDAHGGSNPLESGEFYFYGRGRSLYQGHGLGFSQYGSFGGAQHGMNAQQIATFYYQGSSIGSQYGTIEVQGVGSMDSETYVSGLGEIPDKACGTQEQVNSRPDKYALDNPSTIWDCWPEESIKAQVIVARSFALAYGGPICTSATCQVYKGGQGKRWAADETSGQVVQVGGSTVKAYYSSDNNNGWGTGTHRNPMWCWDFAGNCGGGFSWLQSVNDSSFAAKGPYTDWTWRTNSYSLADIQSMFNWYANAGYSYPSSGDVRGMLNSVGTIQNLSMQRDASGRVARVEVIGSGGTRTINGDFFKMIWNFWVGNVQPSGEVDPIFSLTYHFVAV